MSQGRGNEVVSDRTQPEDHHQEKKPGGRWNLRDNQQNSSRMLVSGKPRADAGTVPDNMLRLQVV